MKKSLTVTWYKNNYGSILQAFALQYTITKLGIYNDILDFRFSYLKKLEFLLNTNAWFKIIKDKISIKFIEIIFLKKREKEIKYIRFYDFYKNYLKISNPIFNNI